MDIMKVYIAGKITGEPEEACRDKFLAAERRLRLNGYQPVNPFRYGQERGTDETTWNEYMKLCIPKLLECDAILLLPDWKDSEGAKFEKLIADKLNIKILE